jgi:hypothetical protein
MSPPTTPPEQRFWPKVEFADCWLWTGATVHNGYAVFRLNAKRVVYAHRWAYEHLVGDPGDGMELDHLCRVRRCVNPDHLEPVTHAENTRRGYGPTSSNGAMLTCALGHPLVQAKTQRFCRTCRNKYAREYAARRKVSRE